MNVLIVGSGKGSWTMRGLQLGAAIGARVTSTPSAADWAWATVAVLIKRAGRQYAPDAHRAGAPIVWDALDFWRQPFDNARDERDARALLGAHLAEIRPALTIGATQAMAEACDGVYLPHHSWSGLEPTAARERVQTVAYEGNGIYLGRWDPALRAACARRGWAFVINPPDLRVADLLVGFRDGGWDGWMCQEWKSGVKVVNAIAAGRPFIGQPSAAIRELSPSGTTIRTPDEIEAAFDAWTPADARSAVVEVCRWQAPSLRLSAIASRFEALLRRVEVTCAA